MEDGAILIHTSKGWKCAYSEQSVYKSENPPQACYRTSLDNQNPSDTWREDAWCKSWLRNDYDK
jgi:hypothetical protein